MRSSTAAAAATVAFLLRQQQLGCVSKKPERFQPKHPEVSPNMDRIGVSFLDPLDDYELIHRIGCGTYGDVFKVSANILLCFAQPSSKTQSTF